MSRYIFSSLFSLFAYATAFGQFEQRLNLYVGIGITPFQPDQLIQTETIFQGYRTTPVLHTYVGYALNRKLAMGGSLRQIVTSKNNYLLTNTCVGYGTKYNFIPFDKPVSPFVYAEVGINYTFLSQAANSQVVAFPPPGNPIDILVTNATLQEPEIQVNIFPSASALLGAGAEFTLKRVRKKSLGFFVFGGYVFSSTARAKNVLEYFPRNESKFNYPFICAGARFSFLQRKSLY